MIPGKQSKDAFSMSFWGCHQLHVLVATIIDLHHHFHALHMSKFQLLCIFIDSNDLQLKNRHRLLILWQPIEFKSEGTSESGSRNRSINDKLIA